MVFTVISKETYLVKKKGKKKKKEVILVRTQLKAVFLTKESLS